jgi:pimeloyl-ACP methyl ester carboxylesterase
MMRLLLLLSMLLITPKALASTFKFSDARGPYQVGLRVVSQYDFSRTYKGKTDLLTGHAVQGERARPVRTLVWYPAINGGKPVTYGAYVDLATTEVTFGAPETTRPPTAQSWIAKRWYGLSAAKLEQEVSRPMWAVRDAQPASGKFPVVIYAPSFGASAHESADLCEFLASHGYVVLSSPSVGARSRDMTHDLEGVEAQASDIGFLISYARSLPQSDTDHVGVVGYSWGGMANVLSAARDSRIGALVSLDGSVRYFPALVSSAKYVTPGHLTAPFLFLGARPRTTEDLIGAKQDMSASLINEMHYNDVYVATMYPMEHPNFSAEYQRFAPDDDWGFREYSREETSLAYSWMARYVGRFLDAYLKNDREALAFLKNEPVANGAPRHMLAISGRTAVGAPPTIETLAAELGKRGFDHAEDGYRALAKADPSFQPSEEDLRHWGYQLLWNDRNMEAIAVFRLVTTLFPQSANAFDCLGEAYQQNRDYGLAIQNYRESLKLDPGNTNAAQHIAALKLLAR